MQIIQSIREKGAAVVIGVIALSLIGFILMDAKQGSNKLFSSNTADLGKINGSGVSQSEFSKKVLQLEQQEEQRSGQKATGKRAAEIREQVWNQIVAEKVFYAEADKLGIDFTSKELSTILSSDDQDNPLMQDKNMVDPTTGKIDQAKLKEAFSTIKKAKGEQFDNIDAQVVEPQKLTSISQKYFAMLNASAYYPSWMEEADTKDAKSFATISYVAIPYNTISDSTIKVSDDEVAKYVSSHKDLFKQEAGRTISYVTFSQLPNGVDSANAKDQVEKLKEAFSTDNNPANFIARNSSAVAYDSTYQPKAKIRSTKMDTILKQPQGTVYGPYVDNGAFVLAKVLGSKTMPDSAKVRHILIATVDGKTGQPIMADSVAKKQADSILTAIQGGADFGAMVTKYSTDPGSKDKGGVYDFFPYGQMVSEFNDYSFGKPVGSKAVVKTQFGYHIIEVLGQKGSSPVYKTAFMAKEILASDATINTASLEATKASAAKESTKLDAYLKTIGKNKVSMPTIIKENAFEVGQLQDARSLVKWAFEAKKGEVSDPFSIGDQFVVAVVDNIYAEGTQDVKTARAMAEGAVRDAKKAEMITAKLTATPTLESAAAAYAKQVQVAGADSSIVFGGQTINGIGNEPKLIGAAFNKEYQTKASAPIVGKTGVYVIKVNSISEKAAETLEALAAKRSVQVAALRNTGAGNWFEGLKKQATIKDNRSKFY